MMIPDLQTSILCDDVRQERNGKFILIGIFDILTVPKLPAAYPRLCIYNRWCCGSGTFKQRSRIIAPDDSTTVVEGKPVKVKLKDKAASATCVEFFLNVSFPVEGVYWVETLLDDNLKLRHPLRIQIAQQQKQNQPNG